MRSSVDACIRRAVLLSVTLLLAGCAATPTVARHEARVRDAWQCELEAEEYLRATQNANDIRYLMIEACMAMRGYRSR
jgi:outer membrane biogenesis lipoprotein LolB